MTTDEARHYRMRVQGMTCSHCAEVVTGALEGAGAQEVSVDYLKGEATFRFAGDLSTLRQAVIEAGYVPDGVVDVTQEGRGGAMRDGHDYDLVVVGSGGAAFAGAIRATELGARVLMIERGTVGGTCVNVGCIPSKFLLRSAEVYHEAAHHPYRGVETRASSVDLGELVRQKGELTERLRQEKYLDLIGEYGWELELGEARFVDDGTLEVNGHRVRGRHYLLATGARPAVPPIPGLEEAGYLTSTTAMELDHVPESLLIIGAGYVALELGMVFRRLGSQVTIMQRGDRILREYEPEVSDAVMEVLRREGIAVLTGARVERVLRDGGSKLLEVRTGDGTLTLRGEEVLVATGRSPNVEALDLPVAGVQLDDTGAVAVDEAQRTTNPRVWAAGDVTRTPQFVYVAAYEGGLAAGNALTGARTYRDLSALPSVIFTQPQIASVGMTEAEARAKGLEVRTSILPLDAVPRARVNGDDLGLFKLVAEASSDRLLGAQVVAENAGDVIYAAVLATRFGLRVSDLLDTFAPYLTMAEGLKLAAQSFSRDVKKLSCCAA